MRKGIYSNLYIKESDYNDSFLKYRRHIEYIDKTSESKHLVKLVKMLVFGGFLTAFFFVTLIWEGRGGFL